MKRRLLLSLCIVGAVFSGHPSHLPQIQSPSATAKRASEAQESARLPHRLMARSTPESGPWFERIAVRSQATAEEDTPSTSLPRGDSQGAPLPNIREGSEPSVPQAPEEANWVVVIRFATVHSGPSVSAPMVGSYSVGTELQLTDYQQGWFQVLDPASSQRGWIYEKYYLQAIRGPGQGVAALQALAKPQAQKVVNTRNSTPHIRRAKSIEPRPSKKTRPAIASKKTRPVIASAPRYRYETVASILDRALRP
jgi:hypothetical protein